MAAERWTDAAASTSTDNQAHDSTVGNQGGASTTDGQTNVDCGSVERDTSRQEQHHRAKHNTRTMRRRRQQRQLHTGPRRVYPRPCLPRATWQHDGRAKRRASERVTSTVARTSERRQEGWSNITRSRRQDNELPTVVAMTPRVHHVHSCVTGEHSQQPSCRCRLFAATNRH